MKPSQLASQLRRIASAIDNSKNPDRTLVSKDLKKVLAAMNAKVDEGEVFTVAPSSGSFESPYIARTVSYKIENVDHAGEKGFEGLRGSISIDGGPWISIDAEAYKSGSMYEKLSSDDPSFDVHAFNEQLRDSSGFDLGEVLASCIDNEILKYVNENGITYNQLDGPSMDLRIDNNKVYDDHNMMTQELATKPSQLASQLRRIASKIDASKNPNRDLVAKDLKRVIAVLTAPVPALVQNSINYFAGDDRSIGTLEFKIQVGPDILTFKSSISSGGGFEDQRWKLDGKLIESEQITDQLSDLFDLGNPPDAEAMFYGKEEGGRDKKEVYAEIDKYERNLPKVIEQAIMNNGMVIQELVKEAGILNVMTAAKIAARPVLVARDLKRTLAALAATFSPRPGDDVAVTPAGRENEFRVEGILDGVALAGVAVTHRDGGLEFRSDDGSELSENVYDTLCDIMGDADTSWYYSDDSMRDAENCYLPEYERWPDEG